MKKVTVVISILLMILVVFGYQYYKTANVPHSAKTNQNTTTPSSIMPPKQPLINDSKTRQVFSDQHITFEYPLNWKPDYGRQLSDPYVINIDFISDCNPYRVASFAYKSTDPKDPGSYILGQKNPNGPAEQTSQSLNISGIKVGINTQPVGDGSGGYEPKTVVDFLSKSEKFHYYFIAVKGCRNSFEETYQLDVLPVIRSVKLLD